MNLTRAIGLKLLVMLLFSVSYAVGSTPSSSFTDVDKLKKFLGNSTAVYHQNTGHRIGVNNLSLNGDLEISTVNTPLGKAIQTVAHFGKESDPVTYTVKVKELINIKATTVQAFVHNNSGADIDLYAFDLFESSTASFNNKVNISDAKNWLVTPLMMSKEAKTLNKIDNSFKEVALFYNTSSEESFLVGPVGPADAHCRIYVKDKNIKCVVEMDKVLVEDGETRRSEEMVLLQEEKTSNIDMWTQWVAITHNARTNKNPIYGWCSWYDRTTNIDEAHVMDVTKTIENNPNTFGKGIVQIDDGYQKMDGDWTANDKFPSGMANVAKRIREAGGIPGVWFAPLMINPEHPWLKANPEAIQSNAKGIQNFMNPNPFHPDGANWINPTHPKSKKFLANIIKDARDRGFGYIKIDFNGIGQRYIDPKLTRLQTFRELYTLYRESAGEEMYILSCLGQPTRGVIGFVDAARVGPDSHPAHFDHCLESVLRFQIYHRVWWNNDADVSYLAEKLESRRVGHTHQGVDMWKTWHNVVALTGGTAMVSEPINKDDVKAKWRNYEIMRPSSRELSQLLTLGESPENTIFGFNAERTYGDFAVYNLYNVDKKKSHSITLDFEKAGLPKDTKCAVYDFWENKVIGYATNSYTAKKLPKNASALLRFTPIKGEETKLLGSNLHLSCGATEIDNIFVSAKSIKIELSDAGAQEGDLIFHSIKEVKAGKSENCKIKKVTKLGDNLWKVTLSNRIWNTKQEVSLELAEAK